MANRNAINPPRFHRPTPPVSAEARALVDGDKDFAAFQARLNAQINANTPTWRKVLYNIKGLLRKGK